MLRMAKKEHIALFTEKIAADAEIFKAVRVCVAIVNVTALWNGGSFMSHIDYDEYCNAKSGGKS